MLVVIIILVISFAIILLFLWRLNPGEETDKQICRESVLLRSQEIFKKGNLDCHTNYVCISGGDECKSFNPSTTIKVDGTNKEEITEAIAKEMADCWWMFGEGKVDYSGEIEINGIIETIKGCGICSVIKFDEKISVSEIPYEEFYNLINKPMQGKTISYIDYIYEVNDPKNIYTSFKDYWVASVEDYFEESFENDVIDFTQKYYVVTGQLGDPGETIPVLLVPQNKLDKARKVCLDFDIILA